MAVTASTVAAAATMLAAVAAIFLSFVLCFYICLCAKRSSARASSPPPPPGSGVLEHLRYLFCGSSSPATTDSSSPFSGAALWFYDGGLDDASMASLPKKEVSKGDAATDCAVCITELAPGDTARVLPRCGHGFHVDCVDMWLKSHSTCPLCRCPAVDSPPLPPAPVHAPEADPDSPNFPTNVLFFGSQDDVSTGRSAAGFWRDWAAAASRVWRLVVAPSAAAGHRDGARPRRRELRAAPSSGLFLRAWRLIPSLPSKLLCRLLLLPCVPSSQVFPAGVVPSLSPLIYSFLYFTRSKKEKLYRFL